MLLGAGSEPRSGKEKMSVLRVEGTLLEGRDSVVLRARDGGWGECLQGTDKTHFVREPAERSARAASTAIDVATNVDCAALDCAALDRA